MTNDNSSGRYCVIIPAYKEAKHICDVVQNVLKHVKTIVVIDDGSPDSTADEAQKAGAIVLRHEVNKGKAMALNTGFDYACKNGFEALITMDGDGQHDPDDIAKFIEAYTRTGFPAQIGNRMTDNRGMPLVRRMSNRFTSWMLSREMKQYVPDSQNGYRLYRCDILPLVRTESSRFAAESEILLRIADLGFKIGAVPIKTVYRDEKSKVNPIKDTIGFMRVISHHRRERKEKT
ncbi:MAG: glycosyltransferase family 2 protein [bacterium]